MAAAQLKSREDILSFMLGGNATFTLWSHKTGKYFTYKLEKFSRPGSNLYSLRTGNFRILLGTVSLFPATKTLRYFPPRQLGVAVKYEPEIEAFKWFLRHMTDSQIAFIHEGTCARCARPLTDPISIARGFGPECIKYACNEHVKEIFT